MPIEYTKVMWNLPTPLAKRVSREAARRARVLHVRRGAVTATAAQALEIGLKVLEKEKLPR